MVCVFAIAADQRLYALEVSSNFVDGIDLGG